MLDYQLQCCYKRLKQNYWSFSMKHSHKVCLLHHETRTALCVLLFLWPSVSKSINLPHILLAWSHNMTHSFILSQVLLVWSQHVTRSFNLPQIPVAWSQHVTRSFNLRQFLHTADRTRSCMNAWTYHRFLLQDRKKSLARILYKYTDSCSDKLYMRRYP